MIAGRLLPWLFPGVTWSRQSRRRELFLTFDDGPVPGVTDWVLDVLGQRGISATFFCVGARIEDNPCLVERIWKAGHKLGNHTFDHLSGWCTKHERYVHNVERCRQAIARFVPDRSAYTTADGQMLFRPPYGRLGRRQLRTLRTDYAIVMWSAATSDFVERLPAEACLARATRCSVPGAIVLFHDNLKAEKNLRAVLPRYVDRMAAEGYAFGVL